MNEVRTQKKINYIPVLIIGFVILAIAIWFFASRKEVVTNIQPTTGDTASSSTGVPPDSLHH